MNNLMKDQLLALLRNKGPIGPSAMATALKISPQMVHRHLKNLLMAGEIRKQGASPKVLYFAIEKRPSYRFPELSKVDQEYIEQHYFTVKPDGEVMIGLVGFQWWALKTQQHKHFQALASEYITTHKKYNDQYRNQIG